MLLRNSNKSWAEALLLLLLLLAGQISFAHPAVIDSVEISGTEKTKNKVILRVLTHLPGDTLDTAAFSVFVKTNTSNIYNTGLFNNVIITPQWVGDSINLRLIIKIEVKERWYLWPNPYLAFEERTFAEWWQDKDLDRLVYGMGVTWENVSGWNDRIFAYGQLGYSRRVATSYYRPFLFAKAKIDGLFGLRYINNKEIGYGTVGAVLQLARLANEPMRQSIDVYAQLGKRLDARRFIYLTANFQYFKPNDSIVFFNEEYLTTRNNEEYYPSLTLSFVNDQRDFKAFPLSGYKYSFLARQSGLPGVGTTVFTKFIASFSQHLALSRRWNFAWGAQGYAMLGDRVPFFDKFFVGLDNFIRGYEPYVIDGSHMALVKTELKFAIIPRHIIHVRQIPFRKFQDFPLGLYLTAFCDGGIVHDATFNNHDQTLKDKLLAGFGGGINFVTMYDKLLRVEFSMNRYGGYSINLNTTIPIR